MATAADVEHSINALAKRIADASPAPGVVPDRTILCVVPDLETAFWVELKDARLSAPKQVDAGSEADARLTARSDDLIALLEGRMNAGMAFLTGKVRVDASARDLMLLRNLF